MTCHKYYDCKYCTATIERDWRPEITFFFLQNDQNYKGASKKPSSVTGLSDRSVRCKIKLVIWRYAVSEVLNKYKEEKFNLTEKCALSPF